MNTYDIIYEELCNRVETGELTLEDAETINGVAYDRYFTEKKATWQYRLEKFKKAHNYDPKTQTIELNGERVKLENIGGSIKKNKKVKSTISKHNGTTKLIVKPSAFNLRHPTSHEFLMSGHERGHIDDHKVRDEVKKWRYEQQHPVKTKIKNILPRKSKANENNSNEVPLDIKQAVQLRKDLRKYITDNNLEDKKHGNQPAEYIADYYGATHLGPDGKKIAKNALKDVQRTKRKQTAKDYKDRIDLNNKKQLKRFEDWRKESIHEYDTRIKALDVIDKNPNAEYIRKRK